MAKIRTIQIYRGTTAQNDGYTGSAGELTMDTTTNEIRIHDGSTAGGHIIPKKADCQGLLGGGTAGTLLTNSGTSGTVNSTSIDATPTDGSNNPVSSDGVYDALASKADSNLTNATPTSAFGTALNSAGIRTVVAKQDPTSNNNYTWYRKYSDGWVEQGGKQTGSVAINLGSAGDLGAANLPVAMADTNYYANAVSTTFCLLGNASKTTTKVTFKMVPYQTNRTLSVVFWEVKGKAA